MKIPRGQLVRSRVVSDPAVALAAALDRELTGYAVLEPQDALLLDRGTTGVLTFEDGVPVLAYDLDSDRGGADALADLAVPGPYRVELYALEPSDLAAAHDTPELTVPPGTPAERLAGDPDLAERTRNAAPAERRGEEDPASPVEAFLADEEKIAAIQQQAREEATRRAEEWGLGGELRTDESAGGDPDAFADDPDAFADDSDAFADGPR
jgi:hypothetical protein